MTRVSPAVPTALLALGLAHTAAPVLAQTTQPSKPVETKDLTSTGLPIKFYGFVRLDAYYNTARMNNVILPATVLPENGTVAKENDDQFALDPRLTRFGFDVKPGKVGSAEVNLKLETDFANFPTGTTESRATPRIRLAYIDVLGTDLGLRVGQDWDVISPLFPSANGEFLMWNAGNTGDRRPQIQGRWVPKDSMFEVKAALGLTGAINNEDLDVPTGERDGFDAGMPHAQVRAGIKRAMLVEKKDTLFGVWGAFGRTETDTFFNGENRFDIWTLGLDLTLPLTADLALRGEAWLGENLGDFRGCIGQTINRTTGSEIASAGGWAEVQYSANATTKFHVGATLDDPHNEDLLAGNPKRNSTVYAGTIMDWDCGLRTGFDAIYWETEWTGQGLGTAMRFDLYFQYNF